MRAKIINQYKFLGFTIYKRTRISETEIEINNDYSKDFFVGLYPIAKYPKLEFDYVSLYQQKDWDKTAVELFYKAFMHLLFTKSISVYSFNDNKNILGTFNFKVDGFLLKLKDSYFTEDIFLNIILKSIKEVEEKYRVKSNLKYNVEYLINEFLGSKNNEHNRPEKKFITRLIKRYSQRYSWVDLEKETKYLGLVSNYKVKIEESKLLLLNDSFRSLSAISLKEKRNNKNLGAFEKTLSELVESDFKKRYPSNDHDSDVD